MTSQRYIVIERWGDFQHYRDRNPLWIKTYTRLLDDDAYLDLTSPQRALLHGLWLAYGKTHGKVPESTAWLSRYLGMRVTKAMIERLIRAGFISTVASRALAERYHAACLEIEKEKETPKSPSENIRPLITGSAPKTARPKIVDTCMS